ncbi:hypothetical protein [Actinoplanes sp. TFC3]|uniref:hypothetical protein n=1 Tax=Actinoplanes sp. TFC3 TaxID=1710355 RepID=UPI000835E0D0|nr:hypothetical protein [Actinoplanes sp. TFC3]
MRSYWKRLIPRSEPAPTQAFGYFKVIKPLYAVIIVMSVIEIPGLDLIVAHVVPWEPARWIGLAVGVAGLVWMLWSAAALARNPHVIGADGIRIRRGAKLDIFVPWDDVERVSRRARALQGTKSVQEEDGILQIGVASQTTIDIRLVRPQRLPLPEHPTGLVSEVHIYADDPDGFQRKAEQLCRKKSTPRSDVPASPTR